jgi:hypothetical protein
MRWAAAASILSINLVALAGEPVRVVPDGVVARPRQPQAAVDATGAIYVAYGAGEQIYCSISIDGGTTFATPVLVGKVEKLALGARRGPRICASSETIVITAAGHAQSDLVAWRSTDQGRNWHGPVTVNDVPGAAPEGLHAMAAGPDGRIYCVWLDLRDRNREFGNQIVGSVSTDGGCTWSTNQLIYRSPSGSVCECCHPAVTYDRQGNVYVMWRNSLEGRRDMYISVSRDGGKTFSTAEKLGSGTWQLAACPMDGGYLAVTAAGKVTTVWRREKELFRTDSGRFVEEFLANGEQPWITATPRGVGIVWLSHRWGDLWLQAPSTNQGIKIADDANDPSIAASIGGVDPVVVVWEGGSRSNSTIMSVVVGE